MCGPQPSGRTRLPYMPQAGHAREQAGQPKRRSRNHNRSVHGAFLLSQRGGDGSDEVAHGKQRRQRRACAKQRCQLRHTVDGIGQNRRGQIDQSRAAQRYRQRRRHGVGYG